MNACCDACGVYLTQPHTIQVSRDLRTLGRFRLCHGCAEQAEQEIATALCCALGVKVTA